MGTETTPLRFDFKIVVAGAFAVGKTTLISAISEQEVVGTEVNTTGVEAEVKETTTVGTEYGTFAARGEDMEVELNLYGVPGQERFSFMWDVVARGMDALLLLVDASRPETWAEAQAVHSHFQRNHPVPTLVAINRAEGLDDALERVRRAVPTDAGQYVLCDPRDLDSARGAVVELLFLLLESMEDGDLDDHEAGGDAEAVERSSAAAPIS